MQTLGTLSADESRYADLVAAGAGLDRRVVVAWIGSESGWGVTKPGHNYLNVGPGRSYPSTETAANDAIATARALGIHGATAGAQVAAIGASQWGTSPSLLANVYSDLTGDHAVLTSIDLNPLNPLDPSGAIGGAVDALGLDPTSAVGDALTGALGDLVAPVGRVLLSVVLAGVFTTAALALILLGITRLSGTPATQRVVQGAQLATSVAGVAALA